MGLEPVEFLADVGFGGEQDRLLVQPRSRRSPRDEPISAATSAASRARTASGLRAGLASAAWVSALDRVEPLAAAPSRAPRPRRGAPAIERARAPRRGSTAPPAQAAASVASSSLGLGHLHHAAHGEKRRPWSAARGRTFRRRRARPRRSRRAPPHRCAARRAALALGGHAWQSTCLAPAPCRAARAPRPRPGRTAAASGGGRRAPWR